MKNHFHIELLSLSWLENMEEQLDQCAHGHVLVQIGDETISSRDSGLWTVSATALYLLRSIERNVSIDDFGSQLLPCCGFNVIVPEGQEDVLILGCPSGINWSITHSDEMVIHTSEKGEQAAVPINRYKVQVLEFSEKVMRFYKESKPKVESPDKETALGFKRFWIEWDYLLAKHF